MWCFIKNVFLCFQACLAIFDVYAAQRKREFLDKLAAHNILVKFIPAGCTGEVQPLDVAINDVFKKKLKHKFTTWYSDKVKAELDKGIEIDDIRVDLKGVQMKPVNALWVISTLKELGRNPDLITTAWEKSGILGAVKEVLGKIPPAPGRQGLFELFSN